MFKRSSISNCSELIQKTCDPANKNFSKIEHRIAKLSRETFDEAGGGIVVEVVSNTNSLLISNPR